MCTDPAVVNPPFIYGPIAAGFPTPDITELGTNRMLYSLIAGKPGRALPPQIPPLFCDVRDVARAHVAALKAGSSANGRSKRYLISGGVLTWKEATEHLAKTFPDLQQRLPSTERVTPLPGKVSTIDARPGAEDLGMTEYIPWEKTVEDTISSLLEVEKVWESTR